MRILFVADVFGPAGSRAVQARLPGLRDELGVDFCVVNGENVADGRGITPKLADRLLTSGADVVTLGNHTWARTEIQAYLAGSERVIRPANLGSGLPGRGLAVAPAADGTPVEMLDELVEEARRRAKIVVVDFHAEATSEKIAVARILDGRVTAVLGTH